MINLLISHWSNWHFHKWSSWSKPISTAHDETVLQSRRCKICGKIHVAKIKQPWNVWFDTSKLTDNDFKE